MKGSSRNPQSRTRLRRGRRYYNQSSSSSSRNGLQRFSDTTNFAGIYVPRSPFRPRERTILSMVTQVNNSAGGAVVQFTNTYKGNSMHSLGPQTNFAGAFGANAASQVQNFLGATAPAGSNSRYNRYRVYGSTCSIQWTPFVGGALVGQIPVNIVLLPSTQPSYLGTLLSTLQEQPFAKSTLTGTTGADSFTLTSTMRTARLTGLTSDRQVASDDDNAGIAGGDPIDLWYWHVLVSSADFTTAAAGFLRVVISYDVEFFSINQLDSVNV